MKRVTVLFDDELLYREVKMEAAREGRPVKDVVAEALTEWLRRKDRITPEQQRRRQEALLLSDKLRATQPVRDTIQQTLDEMREELP